MIGKASRGATSSGRRRGGLLLTVVALVVSLVVVSSVTASKEVVTSLGSPSASGAAGQFGNPRDVAVNESGAGLADAGDFYVVDSDNHRIQQFAAGGAFVRAWGADVSQPTGGSDFEICAPPAECKAGVASGGNGTVAGNGTLANPQSVAVDQDTGLVYVSDRNNRRIDVYDGAGAFRFAVGRDVQDADGGTTVEICGDVVGDVCRQGDGGNGPGEIGAQTNSNTLGIAVTPPNGNPATGMVFLADSQNARVNTYALDGTAPASFGTSTQFGSGYPRKLTVDSRGIVYASASTNFSQVIRYDSAGVHGVPGFLAPITATNATPPGPLLPGAATASSGLAVDPDSDGAGSDEDVLYVLRDPTAARASCSSSARSTTPARRRSQPVDDTHGIGAGLLLVNGLGLDSSSGRLFVTTGSNDNGHRVWILDDVADPPTATIGSVTGASSRGATFNGFVDPNGAPTGYHFEYSDDGVDWTAFPVSDTAVGSGSSPVAVSATVSGVLEPNTTYQVRLVAKRTSSPATDTSAETTFTTLAEGPTIAPFATADAGTTTATLYSRVTPNSQATTYRFEWGATTAYGNLTPPVAAGAGSDSVLASAAIAGLTPGTTYHFRLLASNGSGNSVGPDKLLHHVLRAVVLLQRRVPPGAGGIPAGLPRLRAGLTHRQEWLRHPVGRRVRPQRGRRRSVRGRRRGLRRRRRGRLPLRGRVRRRGVRRQLPPVLPLAARCGGMAHQGARTARHRNGNRLLQRHCVQPRLVRLAAVHLERNDPRRSSRGPGQPVPAQPRERRDRPGRGFADRLLQRRGKPGVHVRRSGARHVLHRQRADRGPGQPPSVGKVYEASAAGLRLVSRQPGDDAPFQTAAVIGDSNGRSLSTENAVSGDGSSVFFSTPAAGTGDPRAIYRRANGVTTLASPSKRTPADPNDWPITFQLGSADGRRLFFTSPRRLTDDANDGALGDPEISIATTWTPTG